MQISIQHYLDHLRLRKLSEHTLLAARSDLSCVERFINKPLVQAKETDIRSYLRSIQQLKATTLRRRITILKGFFNFAERFDAIPEDPMGNIELPKLPQRLPIYLNQSEIQRLLNDLPTDSPTQIRDATLVKLLFFTGIRIGEAIRLNETDIDWEENQLKVIGKGDKERLIPINSKLASVLHQWIQVRNTIKPIESPALFVSLGGPRRGGRLSHDAMLLAVRGCFASIGIPPKKYSPHKLRHTCATELLRKGVPVEQISQILGHAKLDTTLIYAHTEPAKLRSALERLG
jgi:site-specific recombinase XerD